MKPLEGVKFGCTHIDPDVESEVRAQVRALGGEFQYTLDANTNFLVVGRRWADKYNFAICRRNITLLSPSALFDAHLSYKNDNRIDMANELRRRVLKPLEGLRVCVSNMTHEEKEGFNSVISAAGGVYSEAMTARCAVLICSVQDGRKYKGARKWQIPVVHPKWLSDSVKFGHALDPERYEIGRKDAIMEPPAKVEVQAPQLKRKLTSLLSRPEKRRELPAPLAPPLSSTRNSMAASSTGSSFIDNSGGTETSMGLSSRPSSSSDQAKLSFAGLTFLFVGYNERQLAVLRRTIKSLQGKESSSPENSVDYVVVNSSEPSAGNRQGKVITEWAIERSIFMKRNCLDDIWGRPVYVQPCLGFSRLRICISGFNGIEERHVTLLIKLLGAEFTSTMTADREVLVASNSEARKVQYALEWRVPVVNPQWLWKCAMAGEALPLKGFEVENTPLAFQGIPRNNNIPRAPLAKSTSSAQRMARLSSLNQEMEPELEPEGVKYMDDEAEKRAALLMTLGDSD